MYSRGRIIGNYAFTMINKFTKLLFILSILLTLYLTGYEYFSNYPDKLYNILNFQNLEYVIIGLVLNMLIIRLDFKKLLSNPWKGKVRLYPIQLAGLVILNSTIAFVLALSKQDLISSQNVGYTIYQFFKTIGYTAFGTLLTVTAVYTIGDVLLSKVIKTSSGLKHYLYASAIGVMTLTFLMFTAGSTGNLNQPITLLFIVLPILFRLKHLFRVIKSNLNTNMLPAAIEKPGTTILISALINLAGYLFLNMLKPFPVGWDSNSLYLNISNLISQQGSLISGFEAYNWSIFTSIGLVLFKSVPVAFMLSFMGGVWSLLSLLQLSQKLISEKNKLLLISTIVTLPSFVFLSIIDQKTDLGFLFFCLVSVSLFLDHLNPKHNLKYLGILGLCLGFAMGIKYTAVFIIISIFSALAFSNLGVAGMLVITSASLLGLVTLPLLDIRALEISTAFQQMLQAVSGGIFVFSSILSLKTNWSRTKLLTFVKHILLVSSTIFLAFCPWLIFNFLSSNTLSIRNLLYGQSQIPGLDVLKINHALKPDIASTTEFTNSEKDLDISGPAEELGRYTGYEQPAFKYLSIFFDVNTGSNVSGSITDIGFLIAGVLIPLGIWRLYIQNQKKWLVWVLSGANILILTISFLVAQGFGNCTTDFQNCSLLKISEAEKSGMTGLGLNWVAYIFLPIVWFINTTPELINSLIGITAGLIVAVILTLPLFVQTDIKLKALGAILFSGIIVWIFLGFGVYWYAISIFILLFLVMFIFLNMQEHQLTAYSNHPLFTNLAKIIIWGWLILAFFQAFNVKTSPQLLESAFTRSIIESKNQLESLGLLNSSYMDSIVELNSNPEVKIYRVGSFLQFFISKNNQRVLPDNQLDTFNSINLTIDNKQQIAEELKAQGFKYIIYDLNTASIDNTPQRTLSKKVEKFESFLRDNPQLELISTDRRYADENGDQQITSRGRTIKYFYKVFGDQDKLLRKGSVALYKIK